MLSTKPHAKIVGVDATAALAIEGVVAYIDHKDVDGDNKHGAVIYDEEVKFVYNFCLILVYVDIFCVFFEEVIVSVYFVLDSGVC